jgi:hypothetical protein
MACTMFRVRKGEYQCFSSTITLAQIARRAYPELKGGHIVNVLQMTPTSVLLGRLYKGDDIQPDRGDPQARNEGILGRVSQYVNTVDALMPPKGGN